jgi:hypothetical protein
MGGLSVSQTVVTAGKGVEFSTPKTRSGRRVVAIDSVTVEALRQHRLRQSEERLALGLGRLTAPKAPHHSVWMKRSLLGRELPSGKTRSERGYLTRREP